jgi:hypothetical protein
MPVYTAASRISKFAKIAKMSGSGFGPGVQPAEHPVGRCPHRGQPGAVALTGAHAHCVPVVQDLDSLRTALHERVNEFRSIRRLRVEAEQPEPCPGRGEAGEDLRAGELVTAVRQRDGVGAAAEEHEIVSGLTDRECEDLPCCGLSEHELERIVAAVAQRRGDTGPDQVHVHGERGGRRRRRQSSLLAGEFGEAEPEAAEFAGNQRFQVSGGDQLVEVLGEERVVTVIAGGAGVDTGEKVTCEDGL